MVVIAVVEDEVVAMGEGVTDGIVVPAVLDPLPP